MKDDTSTDAGPARITPDDVAPVPTTHLDRERRAARERLEVADGRLEAATRTRDRAISALDQAETAAHASTAMTGARRAALDEASTRLDDTRARLDAATARVDTARAGATGAAVEARRRRELSTRFEQLVAAGPPTDGHEIADTRQRLARLVELAAAGSEPVDTSALTVWSDQLDSGNAPIDDEAAGLLTELARLDAEWLACGGGDLTSDPEVIAATARCRSCQEAVAAMDDGGTGSAGHEARMAIEVAHQRRTEVEARGKRADPDELDAAVRAEAAALAHVGFDSMLDFRIAMSGAGVGALAARRRQVAADELASAVADLERVRDDRARHHATLRGRRAETRRRGLERFGLDDSLPLEDQLRRVLALPGPVLHSAREAADSATAAVGSAARADAALADASAELEAAAAAVEDGTDEVERCTRALDGAERGAASAAEELGVASTALEAAERELTDAVAGRHDAAIALADLVATAYLPEDVDVLVDTLVELVRERLRAGDTVELCDPLADEPVEVTLRLLDAMDAIDGPVELTTSRRALLAATRHRDGAVAVVGVRRHLRRLGQRRRREPKASNR